MTAPHNNDHIYVHLPKKLQLKVLLADLLGEKNTAG
jgi:hypothetical protein